MASTQLVAEGFLAQLDAEAQMAPAIQAMAATMTVTMAVAMDCLYESAQQASD